MDHTTVQSELQAYLDGTLAPEAARAVRAHLDGCAACRAEWALLREVDQALRDWPVLPEPEGLTARVMGAIQAAPVQDTPQRLAAPQVVAALWHWLREHWSEALLGAVLAATLAIVLVSLGAWGTRAPVELNVWELQAQRALAAIERAWYVLRAEAGRGFPAQGGWANVVVQFYCWAAGGIALLAGAVCAGVLARQWRQVWEALGGWTQGRPARRGLA